MKKTFLGIGLGPIQTGIFLDGAFPQTFYLNTVVGKMSCSLPAEECARRGIPTLTPGADRGHLVEAFNQILIQSCEGISERRVQGLYDKPDLLPFEEAKLYGHNAVHCWLGLHAQQKGLQWMHEVVGDQALLARARKAFVEESGAALCRKWAGVDELFTTDGFAAYADDLLVRMVNPFLTDRVDRVCRDLERKLGWDDRVIGTMRLVLSQNIAPSVFAEGVALAVRQLFGSDGQEAEQALKALWGLRNGEAETLLLLIHEARVNL
jgi:mannitol-1-phosphate 5-dehydrogenase